MNRHNAAGVNTGSLAASGNSRKQSMANRPLRRAGPQAAQLTI